MARRLDAVSVNCPTCNSKDVKCYGWGVDTPNFDKEIWLSFRCARYGCPADTFRIAFRVYMERTLMDVEILDHED